MLESGRGRQHPQPVEKRRQGVHRRGVLVRAVYLDLEQIRGLLPEHEEDLVLDVMDLVAGNCHPQARIGHHKWGDPENPIALLDASGFHRE